MSNYENRSGKVTRRGDSTPIDKGPSPRNAAGSHSNSRSGQVSHHRSDYARRSFSSQTPAQMRRESGNGVSKASRQAQGQFSVSNRDGRTVYQQKHYQAKGSALTDPDRYRNDSRDGGRAGQNSRGSKKKPKKQRQSRGYSAPASGGKKLLIGLVVAAVVVGGFIGIRSLLPFNIYLNGTETKVPRASTVDSVAHGGYVELTAGDLVAVDGTTILEEGAGEDYTAILNGYTVTDHSDKLSRGDSLEFAKGANKVEEGDVKHVVDGYMLSVTGTGPLQVMTVVGHNGFSRKSKGKTSGISISKKLFDTKSGFVKKFSSDTKEKVIALTFDAGPSDYTTKILDILKENGAKATFFVYGQEVNSHQSVAKRIVDDGNQIAVFAYSSVDYSSLKPAETREQVEKTQDIIEEVTGVRPTIIRSPSMVFSQDAWKAVAGNIQYHIGANFDTEDWRRPGAGKIADSVLDNAAPGAVIQLRDGGGDRSQTVEALPAILKKLKDAGYSFVTVDELLEMSTIPTE